MNKIIYYFPVNWGVTYYIISIFTLINRKLFYYEDGIGSYLSPELIATSQRNNLVKKVISSLSGDRKGFLGAGPDKTILCSNKEFLEYLGLTQDCIEIDRTYDLANTPVETNPETIILFLSSQDVELGRMAAGDYKSLLETTLEKMESVDLPRTKIAVSLHHAEDKDLKVPILAEVFEDPEIVPPSIPAETLFRQNQIGVLVSPYNSTALFYIFSIIGRHPGTILLYQNNGADMAAKKALFGQLSDFLAQKYQGQKIRIENI